MAGIRGVIQFRGVVSQPGGWAAPSVGVFCLVTSALAQCCAGDDDVSSWNFDEDDKTPAAPEAESQSIDLTTFITLFHLGLRARDHLAQSARRIRTLRYFFTLRRRIRPSAAYLGLAAHCS